MWFYAHTHTCMCSSLLDLICLIVPPTWVLHVSGQVNPYRRRVNHNYSDEVPSQLSWLKTNGTQAASVAFLCWWAEVCSRLLAIPQRKQSQHSKDIQRIHSSSFNTITYTEASVCKWHVHEVQKCEHRHWGAAFHACVIIHASIHTATHSPIRPDGCLISEVHSTPSLESLYFAGAHISVVSLSQTNALPLSLQGLINP